VTNKILDRKILYRHKSGSSLYGTQLPTSDLDYESVFLPKAEDILSLQNCEMIDNGTKSSSEDRRNTSDDVDDHAYSLPRYLDLVLHGNPAMTELLFSTEPEIEDERFKYLKDNYDKLVSLRCYDSFTGFAISQIKKLEYKSKRFNQLKLAIDWLDSTFPQEYLSNTKSSMDQRTSDWLNKNLSEYKGSKHVAERFHIGLPVKVIYEKIKIEYETYGWRVKTDTFELLGYDVKFGSHAIRLLHEGAELLTTGKLTFPIVGESLEDIMKVRRGEVDIEEFRSIFKKYEIANRLARSNSSLREKSDYKWANKWITDILRSSIKNGEI
jgi:predicted nucleotidyltransferase